MTTREYCDKLAKLLSDGLKAKREGRTADKCRIFALHDDMIENPYRYINEEN